MPENTPSNTLTHALEYLSREWSVIPVPHRTKAPKIAWKEYQTNRPSEEQVRTWFLWQSNIAIVTGSISGLVIVDIDLGADTSGLHLPPTYSVRTGSGGFHYYYRYPIGFTGRIESKTGIRPHIDIRADGGIVIAPPSVHPSGNFYEAIEEWPTIEEMVECPEWVLTECGDENRVSAVSSGDTVMKQKAGTNKSSKEKTDWVVFLQEKNSTGTRNSRTTQYVGKLFSELSPDLRDTVGKHEILRYNATNNTPPLEKEEIQSIWQSISKTHKDAPDKGDEKETQAEKIIKSLGDGVMLFSDEVGCPYALLPCEGYVRTESIASSAFRLFLSKCFYEAEGKPANRDSLSQAIQVFEGKARFGKDRCTLNIRTAKEGKTFLYDLCNDSWQYIEIDGNGWRIRSHEDAIFRRYSQTLPQIIPTPDSITSPFRIFDFLNVKESKRLLTLVYILSLFIADMPHPIAIVHGSRWSAKSTFGKVIKKLVDPSNPDLLALPHSKDELVRILNQSWVIGFDNLSTLSDEFSDTLCRAVTGEGYIRRALYTNDDNVVYSYKRCVIINGINVVANRPDLLDRGILIELDRISEDTRKTEKEFWQTFEQSRPALLGGIFDTLSKTLAILPTVHLKRVYRMADFTEFGVAVSIALGYCEQDFLDAYASDITEQNRIVIEDDLVANTLVAFMDTKTGGWSGTASQLYANLLAQAELERQDRYFPKSAGAMSHRIKSILVNLRDIGIVVRFEKDTAGVRWRRIVITREGASLLSQKSEDLHQSQETCDDVCDDDRVSDAHAHSCDDAPRKHSMLSSLTRWHNSILATLCDDTISRESKSVSHDTRHSQATCDDGDESDTLSRTLQETDTSLADFAGELFR